MELKEVTLQELSAIQHEIMLAPCAPFSIPDFKVIAYKGIYSHGSMGSQDARYIVATAKAAHEAWYSSAIILDFTELDYQWGDEMDWVLSIGHQPHINCSYSLAIIVGSKCESALRTLWADDYEQLCFNSLEQALKALKGKVAKYKLCLQEWRKQPNRTS